MAKSTGYLGFFPGVITNKLQESQQFYRELLGFHVIFATDWYIHLQSFRQTNVELGFLVPERPLLKHCKLGDNLCYDSVACSTSDNNALIL
jgi:catechol 2,3-dioxygenase-like lactoylglutathione lyase family enzyme